jgi:hypothetical protein
MKAAILTIHTNKKAVASVIGIAVFSVAYYVYAVNVTVRNVALRQAQASELSNSIAQIGELEFEYINLKNNVDITLAHSLGFRPVEKAIFVSRDSSVAFAGNTGLAR